MKKVLMWIAAVILALIAFALVGEAKRKISSANFWGSDSEYYASDMAMGRGFLIAGLIFFGIVFLIVFFGIMWPTRCKSCKKFFAITKNGVEFLGSEEVSVKVQHEVKNLHGDVTGTVDQYVPGTRRNYRQNYVCKYCGTGYYQDYSNSRANV